MRLRAPAHATAEVIGRSLDRGFRAGPGELAQSTARYGLEPGPAGLRPQLAPFAELFPVVARGACTENVVDYFLGRLAATLGRPAEAEHRLRQAVAANDRIGAAPFAAAAQLRLGQVLADARQHDQARDELAEAQARAERLDMPALAQLATIALAPLDDHG